MVADILNLWPTVRVGVILLSKPSILIPIDLTACLTVTLQEAVLSTVFPLEAWAVIVTVPAFLVVTVPLSLSTTAIEVSEDS